MQSKEPTSAILKTAEAVMTEERLAKIQKVIGGRSRSVIPVLEHLYDLGNVSAVLRSAESFGFFEVGIIPQPNQKFKAAKGVSKGTEKWLDIAKYKTSMECASVLKGRGYKIFATDLKATHRIQDIDFSEKIALVFGNEKEGVSEEMQNLADGTVIIPMTGFAQSFNISVAAAISLYHAHWQRVLRFGQSGDLTPQEQADLLDTYILRSSSHVEAILNPLA